jgi:hypothetical protein
MCSLPVGTDDGQDGQMTELRDVRAEQRFEQGFADADGRIRTVFAD